MADFLGEYKKNYLNVFNVKNTNYGNINEAFNIKEDRYCFLKVIDKQKLKLGDYDFLLEQVKREEEITKLCNSENTVNFYEKLETEEYIIYELEYCDIDLENYVSEKDNLSRDIKFFKNVVLSLSKALQIIHEKGVIHRDIKPNNIFLKSETDKKPIKLGDFGSSIFINDNTSEPIGTIVYSAPEIIKNLQYNEKCDLWSLGITLYELFFGELPYGLNPTINKIMKTISNEKKFKLKKSNIPSLDTLFKRLLTINQKDRINFNEFFNFVFNDNFMKEEEYLNIKIDNPIMIDLENTTPEKEERKRVDKILSIVQEGHLPDIMNFANGNINSEHKYNNIIYYDENINHLDSINKDSYYFERKTPGAFILCTNLESLKLLKVEILAQIKKDKRIFFNLITTGSKCEKIMDFLSENPEFQKCIKNVCIYCMKLEKYLPLKDKYKILHDDIYNKTNDVVNNFINKLSSNDIKPYPITKLITYKDYTDKYKDRHFTISKFYGNLTPDSYKKYIKEIKSIIKEEGKQKLLFGENEKIVIDGFLTFDLNEELKALDKLIIKEYTKNTFYGDLNKWLMNSRMNYYEPVAYFTSRLMYSLNNYAQKNNMFCIKNNKQLYRGVKLTYSNLLPYERAKGKIILLTSFTSTTEDETLANNWSGRDNTKELYETNLKFSVIFYITNINKREWISNGINVQEESEYDEQEILYQPFSFYYLKDVKIDINDYKGDIYLETIGKIEKLEEKIKMGKDVEYNKKENIIQIKK